MRTDLRLGETEESFDAEDGTYSCVLRDENGQVVVAVDAYPEGRERDQELGLAGTSRPPHAVLPGGLPGFEDENSLVYLMPECPRAAGPRRNSTGSSWAPGRTSPTAPRRRRPCCGSPSA